MTPKRKSTEKAYSPIKYTVREGWEFIHIEVGQFVQMKKKTL